VQKPNSRNGKSLPHLTFSEIYLTEASGV